jgi:hypothetical protein
LKKKISLVFFLISHFFFAQGPPPPGLPDEEPVPINQEIGLLLMAGIALGVYVINKKK